MDSGQCCRHFFFLQKKKSWRNPLSLSKQILLLWLGDERTQSGYSIHLALCKALGIDISLYVKSIRR